MGNNIRHSGIVDSFTEQGDVMVRIQQMAACAGCKVSHTCHMAEMKEKLVSVPCPSQRRLSVGDEVVVVASGQTAFRALLIGFALPLALMLAVMAIMLLSGCSEMSSAVGMLLSLIPYYAVVACFRKTIARGMTFWIE